MFNFGLELGTLQASPFGEPPALRTYRVTWAALLQKVFDVDVLACHECEGRLRLIQRLHR
jgi:hypothetical protein